MLDVRVRMYLYRWGARGAEDSVESGGEVYSMHVSRRDLCWAPGWWMHMPLTE